MQTRACQRFRRLAALAVYAQPTQLESLALTRHLEHCTSCRSFSATVERFTRELRAAPLVAHTVAWQSLPRRRRADNLIRRTMAGAAVACVVLLAGSAAAPFRSYALRPEAPRYLPALVVDATGADTARETQRFLQGLRDVSLARSVGGPQSAVPSRPGIQAGCSGAHLR